MGLAPAKTLIKAHLIVLSLVLLAGCGTGLEKAELVTPTGSAFNRSLYEGYVELSSREFREADYGDSDAFAERAIAAAQGEPPPPEALEARRLPPAEAPLLAEARNSLMQALAQGAAEKLPVEAAQAQVSFDCWLQEQEENFQPYDIAACRGGFDAALAYIENQMAAVEPPSPAPVPVESVDAAVAPPPPPSGPRSFVVYFGFDQDRLSQEAIAVLTEIVETAVRGDFKNIEVEGHADLVGPDAYNVALSQKRTLAVVKYLTESGLQKDKILGAGYGAEEPVIDTKKPEPKNRRVEIILSP